jgi:hypothetical protein
VVAFQDKDNDEAERKPERGKEVDQSTLGRVPVAALAVSGKEVRRRTLGSHPVTRARPRLAFLGPAGTFAHAALRTLPLAAGADLLPCTTVTLAVEAVRDGKVDGALVPMENSVEGAVPATLDELAGGAPLVIAEETYLPVVFDLLAKPGTELADVRTLATHPHAEAQCRGWLAERRGRPEDPLFPTSRGRPLSRDAVALLVTNHAITARQRCPSIDAKTITPHVLRHSTAMTLLHAGVDTSVIALWLGHEKTDTVQIYLHADLRLKERALARTTPLHTAPGRYRPPDTLLAFLEAL